jgi:hypothetical protein
MMMTSRLPLARRRLLIRLRGMRTAHSSPCRLPGIPLEMRRTVSGAPSSGKVRRILPATMCSPFRGKRSRPRKLLPQPPAGPLGRRIERMPPPVPRRIGPNVPSRTDRAPAPQCGWRRVTRLPTTLKAKGRGPLAIQRPLMTGRPLNLQRALYATSTSQPALTMATRSRGIGHDVGTVVRRSSYLFRRRRARFFASARASTGRQLVAGIGVRSLNGKLHQRLCRSPPHDAGRT